MKVTVLNQYNVAIPYEVAEMCMDDDLREFISYNCDFESEQDFYNLYAEMHLRKFGEEWGLENAHPQY